MATYRYAVSVMPKPGILDPQGRAVETSLPHLGVDTVHGVRVGRRIELSADGADEGQARETVARLAGELFANPLIEAWWIDGPLGEGTSGRAGLAPVDPRASVPAAAAEGTVPR